MGNTLEETVEEILKVCRYHAYTHEFDINAYENEHGVGDCRNFPCFYDCPLFED